MIIQYNNTATTEIYSLSQQEDHPISHILVGAVFLADEILLLTRRPTRVAVIVWFISEEHSSELYPFVSPYSPFVLEQKSLD